MNRRDFISIISAGIASGLYSCNAPREKIIPKVSPVEYAPPGAEYYYSTVYCRNIFSYGALVKCVDGRPIKIDGNPSHPVNHGAITPQLGASIYSLYDPRRIRKSVTDQSKSDLIETLTSLKKRIYENIAKGRKLRIICHEHCSPTLQHIIDKIENANNNVEFHCVTPIITSLKQRNYRFFNRYAYSILDISEKSRVISFDHDFLGAHPLSVKYGRELFAQSNIENKKELTVFEPGYSVTGSLAGQRHTCSHEEIERILFGIAKNLIDKIELIPNDIREIFQGIEISDKYNINKLSEKLLRYRDKSLILIGDNTSDKAHALGILINHLLGNYSGGKSFKFICEAVSDRAINILKNNDIDIDINNSQILLLENDINYWNPVLSEKFKGIKSEFKYSLSLYFNETDYDCSINIPGAHYLESWSDARNIDGSVSICQPVVSPLNPNSISREDLLLYIFNDLFDGVEDTYRLMKEKIYGNKTPGQWESWLQEGIISEPQPNEQNIKINYDEIFKALSQKSERSAIKINLLAYPSNSIGDGSDFENPFLRELPDPMTKLCWINAAQISKSFAESYGLRDGDIISIKSEHQKIELPVLIQPGIADEVIITNLGFGKDNPYENDRSANLYRFFNNNLSSVYNITVEIEKAGKKYELPLSQPTVVTDGKENNIDALFRSTEVDIKTNPGMDKAKTKNITGDSNKWGLSVDIQSCTACNSCVISCQMENNIPYVGSIEVANGRIMHWIRHERYFIPKIDNQIESVSIPVMCQHCGSAPCEAVCPVNASTHSEEGLNETTYNRCVGSRYCMTNCPYKVRKFNFASYSDNIKEPANQQLNPNVTLRMRGIVEKCSLCIQRINAARYKARDSKRSLVLNGEVTTACQDACPTNSIKLFNYADDNTNEQLNQQDRRNIYLLEHINTMPSVVYHVKKQ